MTTNQSDLIPEEDRQNLREALLRLNEEQLQKMSIELAIKDHTLKYYRDGRNYPDDLVRLRAMIHWAKVEANRK